MCRELRAFGQSIAAYAGSFDARALTPSQAAVVVGLCAQIEASAASIKALAAARSAEGKEWERYGYRSAAEQLADQAGMSPAAAKRALETGRRMAEQPEVAKAALAGELSLEQANAVSDGVSVDPGRAGELIDKAKRCSLPELNEAVAEVKAAHCDQEELRQARHARRSLRRWTDREGAMNARLYGHPEHGALVWRMLDPVRRRLILSRHQAGAANESLDALDYDALMAIASVALGKEGELSFADLVELGLFPQAHSGAPDADSPPTRRGAKKLAGRPLQVMIRVDFPALLRGFAVAGELCEIPGYGPVPVSVVEELIATENPFIVGILTKGQAVSGVYHHGRRPNAVQRSALDFLSPVCTVEGCPARASLEYDHREDFAKTGITAFDLLDRLCRHHHDLKTRKGWNLVAGRGKRAFVPPGHPDHPRSGAAPPGRSP